MNRNTKRKAKLLSKELAAARKAGQAIIPPQRKRHSSWRGARTTRQPARSAS
jgi:hypothetical protein